MKEDKTKNIHDFIQLKDLGGLKDSATDVMEMRFTSEKMFLAKQSENSSMDTNVSNMISDILHFIAKPIFDSHS